MYKWFKKLSLRIATIMVSISPSVSSLMRTGEWTTLMVPSEATTKNQKVGWFLKVLSMPDGWLVYGDTCDASQWLSLNSYP